MWAGCPHPASSGFAGTPPRGEGTPPTSGASIPGESLRVLLQQCLVDRNRRLGPFGRGGDREMKTAADIPRDEKTGHTICRRTGAGDRAGIVQCAAELLCE